MKKLLILAIVLPLLAASSVAKTETDTILPIEEARRYARCAFLAKALKYKEKERRYTNLARQRLDDDDMIFEAGVAFGFVLSTNKREEPDASIADTAKKVLRYTCPGQEA